MKPEEQSIRFKTMPGIGGKSVYVPKLRGGRPERVIEDKTQYLRNREKQKIREMMPVASILRKVAKTGVEYDSFSTQIDLPLNLSQKIKDWCQENIDSADLYDNDKHEYGMENDFHITLLYGIKEKDPETVKDLFKEFKPFEVRLGLITAFRDKDEYDVLKIDAEASELHKMHYTLADNLKNDHSFPTYAPHMTLAYLKKGSVDKYMGGETFKGKTFNVTDVKFCLKDSSKVTLSLK